MVAPSVMSHRRFPQALRLRVEIAMAEAWERLTETHREQAGAFVRRLVPRLGGEAALFRYFREVAVPPLMQETVRARAMVDLAADGTLAQESSGSSAPLLEVVRPDRLVAAFRRRTRSVEETSLACQLAGALADEAVCAAHVTGATALARLLASDAPMDEAILHYIRCFNLPTVQAHMVFQRALAEVAERHDLLNGQPVSAAESVGARTRQSGAVAAPAFGLRAIS